MSVSLSVGADLIEPSSLLFCRNLSLNGNLLDAFLRPVAFKGRFVALVDAVAAVSGTWTGSTLSCSHV